METIEALERLKAWVDGKCDFYLFVNNERGTFNPQLKKFQRWQESLNKAVTQGLEKDEKGFLFRINSELFELSNTCQIVIQSKMEELHRDSDFQNHRERINAHLDNWEEYYHLRKCAGLLLNNNNKEPEHGKDHSEFVQGVNE